jgi:LacI family transcriptional regulator
VTVTIRDIAERVGRSITTVSRALNDYDDVSPETKTLVRRVAMEMGYTPNAMAQRLQKRRTDTIGFIIPTTTHRYYDPFFSEILIGVGNRAAEMGYDLLVSAQPAGERELAMYRQIVDGRRVDGFVLVRLGQRDARVDYLRTTGIPFVAFGREAGQPDFPYVDVDGAYGMRLVVEHLVALGHRRIACICAPFDLNFTTLRLNGLRTALERAGVSLQEDMILEGTLTHRSGFDNANRLLDAPRSPTAIVAFNDAMAIGAMRAAQERGVAVGAELAVTGFDDTPMAEHAYPALTTVRQPIYQIGMMVCEMLVQLIRGENIQKRQTLLQPSLVIRRSCGSS